MRETHKYLLPDLACDGIRLVPVSTSDRPDQEGRISTAYVLEDPVLGFPVRSPEEVDALLLLDSLSAIDFGRILRIRRERVFPVITMVNDLLPLDHPEWFYPDADKKYRVLFQQILHVSDHVVVPSEAVRNDVLALGWDLRSQLQVIPLGSSFVQQTPRIAFDDCIRLLYVSTLAPRKGHDQLLDAFDQLVQAGHPVHLTIIGKVGWMVDELIQRIQHHPAAGSALRWIAHADDELVSQIMSESTIAVIPSEGEGFGLFLEEALTSGLIVVATDLPVFQERPYPNVYFCEGSADSIAQTIVMASRVTPVSLEQGQVRTMRDFSAEVGTLIRQVLDLSRPAHS
jgi:glycosyltransferase involved in cell wall biosynthesis